jgi:predicted CXXCH cytochrome family protein
LKIANFFSSGVIKASIVLVWIYSTPAWATGGYVYDFIGDMSITVGNNATHPAAKNEAIASGTTVRTGDKSYAVLKFEDGQVATLQANTIFHISEYRYDPKLTEKNNIVFSKFKGGMRFITGLIGQRNHNAFRLSTPNATIRIRGTDFEVATDKGSLYSQVISGSISMTNSAGVSSFKAGQAILVKTARSLPKGIPASALPPGIFSLLDAIPTPPATPAATPEASAAAFEGEATSSAIPESALLAGTPGAVLSPPVVNPVSSGVVPIPSGEAPAASTMPASPPSARTVSITGAGATYTGADLPCDFCTGRTDTVATHVEPNTAVGGPVTGDANMFGKHNMTSTGANTGEICAFCHTPQGAEENVSAPRWNRTITTLSSYRAYSSLGSATAEATGSVSMSCLSCHDGSQAPNIAINTPDLRLDVGDTEVTIGNDLRNHHPVGIQYAGGGQNQNAPDIGSNPIAAYQRLADMNKFASNNKFASIYLNYGRAFRAAQLFNSRDADAFGDILTFSNEGDFESTKGGFNKSTYSGTGSGTVWWVKTPGSKKGRQKTDLYLFTRTDMIESIPEESIVNRPYIECATCHDPHSTNSTFLRMPGGNARSQICLTCHNK